MIRKLKYLLFYLLSSFAKASKAIKLDKISEEDVLKVRIDLTDRTEEKNKAYKEWSKPENIAKRIKDHEENAAKALDKALAMANKARKELGLKIQDSLLPPIPPMYELTDDMRGQQPSTVRSMLKDKGFEYDWDLKKWVNSSFHVEQLIG